MVTMSLPGQEPDEEYLAEREQVGWLSVTVVAGVCVATTVLLGVLAALLSSRH